MKNIVAIKLCGLVYNRLDQLKRKLINTDSSELMPGVQQNK